MRAFYAIHKHVRVFVFGVPEGWLVCAYDVQKRQWVEKCDRLAATLKEAKVDAHAILSELTGKAAPELKWH